MEVPFVDLKAQYQSIAGEIDQAIAKVLQGTDFILGEEVGLFEEALADYCEVKHAVGLDSGVSALELALRALDIGPGDEVITVANSFIATASAISFVGAKPILVDSNPTTYNIDVAAIGRAVTGKTRAIIPVHLYGQSADMDPIMKIAKDRDIRVIEDACQAHGARYKGRRVGTFGDAAAFSFYPAKNLGAYGDGGALVTDSDEVAEKVRMLRNYGQTRKYHHSFLAYNHRLDTMQAAILRVKLKYLDQWNDARRCHGRLYKELLKDTGLILPFNSKHSEHVYHLYVVQSEHRDALREWLGAKGIATGMHYPIPIHLQAAYAHLGYGEGDFPATEACAQQILSLPMFPELTDSQIEHVVDAIREFELNR
jgi:dTDP-4-amino-4,6-dideoxygalactose transaminase